MRGKKVEYATMVEYGTQGRLLHRPNNEVKRCLAPNALPTTTCQRMTNLHYYRKLLAAGTFPFTMAGKGVCRDDKVTVNCGLTTAVSYARHGKWINRGRASECPPRLIV